MNRFALYCLIANILGGSTYVAIVYATEGLPDLTIAWLRAGIGIVPFVLFGGAARSAWRRFDRRDWGLLSIVAIPGFIFPVMLSLIGVRWSSAGHASILVLLEPIALVPLSMIFLAERPSRSRLLGVVVALIGAALVVTDGQLPQNWGGKAFYGNIFLALQGVYWAIYSVAAKPLLRRHDAWTVGLWPLIMGWLLMSLCLPLEWSALRPDGTEPWIAGLRQFDWSEVGISSILATVYMAIAASFLAGLLWNSGLRGLPASAVAAFVFVQPLVGLILDGALFHRVPSLIQWGGALVIVAGVILVHREIDEEVAAPAS